MTSSPLDRDPRAHPLPLSRRRRRVVVPGLALVSAALVLAGCSSSPAAAPSSSAASSAVLSEPSSSSAASSAVSSGTPSSGTPSASAVSSSTVSSGAVSSSTVSSSAVSSSTVPSSTVSSGTVSSGAVSSSTGSSAPGLDAKGCIEHYDAATDYFPTKLSIEYSSALQISYRKSFQVLTVTPPGGKAETYVLVRCGAPKPALSGDLADAQLVTTPVTKLYSASTTHLPSLVALDRLDIVSGVSSAAFVSEPAVLQYFSKNKPVEFAPTGTIDAETVITGKPQVLIGGGFADAADGKLQAAGIPVLQDLDAQELTPLGQAEWIKFFGALTGTESAATTEFDAIATEYQRLVSLTKSADKVLVVPNQPYQGEWYVPGGKSNKQQLLADAGAHTANFQDGVAGSVKTSFEKVFSTSAKAPVWIASTTWASESDALKEDPRFARFTAFSTHRVWNPIKGVTPAGGNPYYELGGLRVDLALADLIAIVHPDLLPEHTFTFYQRLD